MQEEHTQKEQTGRPTVSLVFDDGKMLELVYDERNGKTAFALWNGSEVQVVEWLRLPSGEVLCPIAASNNLIRHKVILLPSEATQYDSILALTQEIEDYIRRYVTLSESFTKIATRYVLLSWVYDRFNELPYLRFRGDYGSGKTRALSIVGSILYKPMFASGASTVSPIFHTIDLFQGSLVFDEADFRFSDERAELTKILNNGNARGFPVLRSQATDKKVFDPRAFSVFGPKVVSMREHFEDLALESRFLSETMEGERATHVPINLPRAQKEEALALRNKLLMYRFLEFGRTAIDAALYEKGVSARTNQILIPLLSLTKEEETRRAITEHMRGKEQDRLGMRSTQLEALVLDALTQIPVTSDHVSLKEVRTMLIDLYGDELERLPSSRFLGNLIRSKLNLSMYRTRGTFHVVIPKMPERIALCNRFGVDVGTWGHETGSAAHSPPYGI